MRSASQQQDWLAQVAEEPLDPELEICDPHHHLWERPDHHYLLGDLVRDAAGWNVTETIFIECGASYRESGPEHQRSLGETEFAQRIAVDSETAREVALGEDRPASPVIATIVARCDLTLGARVAPLLAAHLEASGGRLRGIRHVTAFDPHPEIKASHTHPPNDLTLDPAFRDGVAELAKLGLVCETWQYHHQLEGDRGLEGLARAVPEATFVLDHCGGPLLGGPYAGKRDQVFDQWRRGIDAVAECTNVVVKLGGIAMPRNGFDWHLRPSPPGSEELAQSSAPWIRHCLDAFGDDRAMFESNFPVDKVSCSYTVLWNSFLRIVGDHDAAAKRRLFRDNARRTYGIV